MKRLIFYSAFRFSKILICILTCYFIFLIIFVDANKLILKVENVENKKKLVLTVVLEF